MSLRGFGWFAKQCLQFPFRENAGVPSAIACNKYHAMARSHWLEMNSLACVPRNLSGVPKSAPIACLKIKRRWGQKQEEEGAKASQ